VQNNEALVTIYGCDTQTDLILLDMLDLNVIYGMDWLSPYHMVLNCFSKIFTLAMPGIPSLLWKGSICSTLVGFISFVQSQRLLASVCLSYMAYMCGVSREVPSLESILVVVIYKCFSY